MNWSAIMKSFGKGEKIFYRNEVTDLQNVLKIHEIGIAKYVLLEGNGQYFLISDVTAKYHADIVQSYTKINRLKLKCLGGGRMNVCCNSIKVYGYSIEFGSPPPELVAKILDEIVKDKKIELKIGIGY